MKKLFELLFVALINLTVTGQELHIDKPALSDTAAVALEMQDLAKEYIKQSQAQDLDIVPYHRYQFEILAGQYEASIKTIQSLRVDADLNYGHPQYMPFELFSRAKIEESVSGKGFNASYGQVFQNYLEACNDELAHSAHIVFTTYDEVAQFTRSFESNYNELAGKPMDLEQARTLLRSYFLYHVYSLTEPIAKEALKQEENKRYVIKEELIISPRDGAELSVITARKRGSTPMPAVLDFTIYADEGNTNHALLAASKGYAGVVATSRGKRLSKDPIEPYKHEYKDVYAVIDWISQQPWNNGKVGMYGGSFDGFTQWASMKEKVHPALKTIIPSVSVAPGIDAPMENNVFYNFPYKWIPYVTNNKFLDKAANFDFERWNRLQNTWFESGRAFRDMDQIDGTPSPVFQEWISHPSYDAYWQGMIPYKEEFAHIDIPILTTTGYYDDGQRGAMYYYLEHLKYNPDAEHYLLIGPYDHWGAQLSSSANLRGYQIDEVAHLNIRQDLAYQWFDHILKGKEKPELLKDKVNFQVMGTNTWMHKPSLAAMNNDPQTFYLSTAKSEGHYSLVQKKPDSKDDFQLQVDFADRTTKNNIQYFPWPIIRDSLDLSDGLVFMTEPLKEDMILNGSFSGEFKVEINKKDFDLSVNLYELTPEGKYFHLSWYIGRASYAKGREKRVLLNPNEVTTIRFDNTRITSKKISAGSKIVIVVNGNKNPHGQINYGTGGDVSLESIKDATAPLRIKVHASSTIELPVYSAPK
ncbi:CocE/NonD family hydrolase [Lutimonas saemankumensis]|uniref:CocE/NonD family hydrolase n=1 Tax=Lutimonas saemankumensis TaxID=483016 RepID=UPI001CD80357|nr:CocE/NonD family hydrolase [Lutimonas saemankumensis]MCA0931746.1 CocE/NonD family hydrolase [Lutimonas saemankumensis]